jgi:hypothetical protein
VGRPWRRGRDQVGCVRADRPAEHDTMGKHLRRARRIRAAAPHLRDQHRQRQRHWLIGIFRQEAVEDDQVEMDVEIQRRAEAVKIGEARAGRGRALGLRVALRRQPPPASRPRDVPRPTSGVEQHPRQVGQTRALM